MKKNQLLGKTLSKEQQKFFKGGDLTDSIDDQICLTCTEDYDCSRINKGKCKLSTCNNKSAHYCDMS